ncbi:hypothetical protein V2J09_006851 [Rumex salicifolius]
MSSNRLYVLLADSESGNPANTPAQAQGSASSREGRVRQPPRWAADYTPGEGLSDVEEEANLNAIVVTDSLALSMMSDPTTYNEAAKHLKWKQAMDVEIHMASQMLTAKPQSPAYAAAAAGGVKRPIADFHPCVWGDSFLNFTANDQEFITKRKEEIESLKSDVRNKLLVTADMPLENLKLIDTIERLGVAYHFEKEIEESLKKMYDAYNHLDLYGTSLEFRILRQHGYYISCDIFLTFMDEHGNFLDSLKRDVKGLLSLYDAAYLSGHGEEILDKALAFTTAHLKAIASDPSCRHPLAPQIARALVYPNHKGVILIESRHYISFYEKDPSHMSSLLRLSKLEFNLRQSFHKEELQQLTIWWRSFDFPSTFPFIRDRVVEAYLYSVGVFHDPKFSVARVVYTKAFLLLTILDDIYDSYGTIEELEAFTQAIDKWDKSCIGELPDYMKLFYENQYDTYKEFEDEVARLGIINYVPYAVKEVITLSKAYLQEARWCKMKYVPTFDEYFDNALKTSATNLVVVVSLLFNYVEETVAMKTIEKHVAGGVDCYIKQHGASEKEAFSALNLLVENAWKDINDEIFNPTTHVAKPLLPYIYNFCRVMNYVYKNENGYTIVSKRMKDTIKLVFIEQLYI